MEDARHALRGYDYVQEGDRWFSRVKRMTTQSWQETADGFLRYDPDNGAWVPVPYCVAPEFSKISGLNFREAAHAGMFTWVWPKEYVQKMYDDGREFMKAHAEQRALEKGPKADTIATGTNIPFTAEAAAAVAAAVAAETGVEEIVMEPAPEPEPESKKTWWRR